MGRHSGQSEDVKIVDVKIPTRTNREPTVPCMICPERINPRRDVYYSQGESRWCLSHGVSYGPGQT